MECDDNFEKSLVSMKNEGVKCGEIRFTCKSSIVAFFKHAVKNSVFASTTASGYRPATVKSQGNPDLARATRRHGQCTHGQ